MIREQPFSLTPQHVFWICWVVLMVVLASSFDA